jgi:hypothetical protein
MVVHLAEILEVPPRDQNLLLTAAGHAPAYTETPFEDLETIGEVLDFMLAAHEPNLAIVVDRRWDVVRANSAASQFMSKTIPELPAWASPMNVMRLNFHPEGLRLHTVDWEVSAGALLRRLERDVARQPHDAGLHNLLIEVRGYPGVDALPRPAFPEIGDLLVPVTYRIADQELSLFTTISVIGDAHDLHPCRASNRDILACRRGVEPSLGTPPRPNLTLSSGGQRRGRREIELGPDEVVEVVGQDGANNICVGVEDLLFAPARVQRAIPH